MQRAKTFARVDGVFFTQFSGGESHLVDPAVESLSIADLTRLHLEFFTLTLIAVDLLPATRLNSSMEQHAGLLRRKQWQIENQLSKYKDSLWVQQQFTAATDSATVTAANGSIEPTRRETLLQSTPFSLESKRQALIASVLSDVVILLERSIELLINQADLPIKVFGATITLTLFFSILPIVASLTVIHLTCRLTTEALTLPRNQCSTVLIPQSNHSFSSLSRSREQRR